MRAFAVALAVILAPASALAVLDPIDHVVLSAEALAHLPSPTPTLSDTTRSLDLTELRPIVHEAALAYGIGVTALSSEIVLRVGYRYADGNLPDGSVIDGAAATGYTLRGVPLSVGWRATMLPYRVRLFVGADAGGIADSLRYRSAAGGAASGWSWQWELRGALGAHAEVWDFLAARLFVEGRIAESLSVPHAPLLRSSGFGIGLALVATFARPEPGTLAPPADHGEPLLREYDAATATRLERAFELIRTADQAAKDRNFIEAEKNYREAVGMLPHDPETRTNVEVPVRVDWARALIEVGRAGEARDVLERALEINPDHPAAHKLLQQIRR